MNDTLSSKVMSALGAYPIATRRDVAAFVGCNLGGERRSATSVANGQRLLQTAPVVCIRVMRVLNHYDQISLGAKLGLPVPV